MKMTKKLLDMLTIPTIYKKKWIGKYQKIVTWISSL